MKRVSGVPNLVRDPASNALINTNKSDIEEARERKKIKNQKRKEQKFFEERVDNLEGQLSEIKSMIEKLINTRS